MLNVKEPRDFPPPEGNPFNCYPDSVPPAIGLFLSLSAIAVLLIGILVSGAILLGVF